MVETFSALFANDSDTGSLQKFQTYETVQLIQKFLAKVFGKPESDGISETRTFQPKGWEIPRNAREES